MFIVLYFVQNIAVSVHLMCLEHIRVDGSYVLFVIGVYILFLFYRVCHSSTAMYELMRPDSFIDSGVI